MVRALYAGAFDPFTNGHLDIMKRGLKFCDEIVVAVGINSSKKTMFSVDERLRMIDMAANTMEFISSTKVSAQSFDCLLVEFAKQIGATILVRGIRSVSDFEYEINIAGINKTLAPNIETVFLPTSPELSVVSSSMVKEIARYGGDISKFVPSGVERAVKDKFGFVKFGDHQPIPSI